MSFEVTMHFGDGTWKKYQAEADTADEAVVEARTWVGDNAWFEVLGDNDEVVAEAQMSGY